MTQSCKSLAVLRSNLPGASFEGLGAVAPPHQEKEKKKEKKEKREKKERKKGTMNNVKLLHMKCCFFPIF